MIRTNIKKFWRFINPPAHEDIGLEDNFNNPMPSNLCASILNDTFLKNFSNTTVEKLPAVQHFEYIAISQVIVVVLGISKLIDGLQNHSSTGFDLITAKCLKNASAYCSILLTKIFQQSLNTFTFPVAWKIGKVVPVYQTGNKYDPANYRPISLTST